MAEDKQEDSQTDGRAHGGAATRLRETSKWIVGGTFASLVVVLAGTSFSRIGSLFGSDPDWPRIAVASVGAVLGLAGLLRLTRDALYVLSFELFSMPQYAYGTFTDGHCDLAGDDADGAPSADRPTAFFPLSFPRSAHAAAIADMRNRVECQMAPYWPPGIRTFAQFARLEVAVEQHKDIAALNAGAVLLYVRDGALAARGRNGRIDLPAADQFAVRLVDGRLIAVSRGDSVRDDADNADGLRVHPGGRHAVSRADLEWFAKATYLSASFGKVAIAFERMVRRLPFNIFLIAGGFFAMIAAINPPSPDDPPIVHETVTIIRDSAGRETGRTRTTSTKAPPGTQAMAQPGG